MLDTKNKIIKKTGNILVGSKQLIQISDWEDILLGLTKLPMLHMPGDLSERTSPYLLQAGVVLLEMARGEDVPIRLRRMMMACQGDLFNTEVSIEPEEGLFLSNTKPLVITYPQINIQSEKKKQKQRNQNCVSPSQSTSLR